MFVQSLFICLFFKLLHGGKISTELKKMNQEDNNNTIIITDGWLWWLCWFEWFFPLKWFWRFYQWVVGVMKRRPQIGRLDSEPVIDRGRNSRTACDCSEEWRLHYEHVDLPLSWELTALIRVNSQLVHVITAVISSVCRGETSSRWTRQKEATEEDFLKLKKRGAEHCFTVWTVTLLSPDKLYFTSRLQVCEEININIMINFLFGVVKQE